MLAINGVFGFVSNGARTFREASHGLYLCENEGISEIREEMFGEEKTDAEKVRQDWRMLGRDARVTIDKYNSSHE